MMVCESISRPAAFISAVMSRSASLTKLRAAYARRRSAAPPVAALCVLSGSAAGRKDPMHDHCAPASVCGHLRREAPVRIHRAGYLCALLDDACARQCPPSRVLPPRDPVGSARRGLHVTAKGPCAATKQGGPLTGTQQERAPLARQTRMSSSPNAGAQCTTPVGDHAERAGRPRQRAKVREQRPVRAPGQLAAAHLAQHLRAGPPNTGPRQRPGQGNWWFLQGVFHG